MHGAGPQLIVRNVRAAPGAAEHDASGRPIRFGSFELRPNSGELRRRGMQIHVPRQATQVLLTLLEAPGHVRSREELKKRLWPSASYGDFDGRLNKCIYTLRCALGDAVRSPVFIETVSGLGYRFIGPLSEAAADGERSAEPWHRAPIAVLPFAAVDADNELAALGHEIASELIEAIGDTGELKVLAYSQVRHTGASPNPKALFAKFGVRSVIVGELARHQQELSLRAEMVDCISGIQLWGTHCRVALDSVAELPERLARQMADRVSQQRVLAAGREGSVNA